MDIKQKIAKMNKLWGVKNDDVPPYRGAKHNRSHFAELLGALGFTTGAEIGVNWGKHAKMLLETIPGLYLYAVDPWLPCDTPKRQKRQDQAYNTTLKRFEPHNKNVDVCRQKSMDAVHDFANESLDFVYIDAMHDFDNVMMDLVHWAPKVKIGGIIAGHDYHQRYKFGVIEAVNAYTRAHHITEWYITGCRWPSYFWLKTHDK